MTCVIYRPSAYLEALSRGIGIDQVHATLCRLAGMCCVELHASWPPPTPRNNQTQRDAPHTIIEMDSPDDVLAVLAEFDRCFASGDAESLSEMFTIDAQLLLLHRDAIEGRSAIMSHWTRLFGEYDPGAWRTEPQTVEVHGDHAYALSFYSETLVNRSGGASLNVWGRLVFFMRRDPGGPWRMAAVMNSHVRPVEQVPAQPGEGS